MSIATLKAYARTLLQSADARIKRGVSPTNARLMFIVGAALAGVSAFVLVSEVGVFDAIFALFALAVFGGLAFLTGQKAKQDFAIQRTLHAILWSAAFVFFNLAVLNVLIRGDGLEAALVSALLAGGIRLAQHARRVPPVVG